MGIGLIEIMIFLLAPEARVGLDGREDPRMLINLCETLHCSSGAPMT